MNVPLSVSAGRCPCGGAGSGGAEERRGRAAPPEGLQRAGTRGAGGERPSLGARPLSLEMPFQMGFHGDNGASARSLRRNERVVLRMTINDPFCEMVVSCRLCRRDFISFFN